jgi:hypothetical protein
MRVCGNSIKTSAPANVLNDPADFSGAWCKVSVSIKKGVKAAGCLTASLTNHYHPQGSIFCSS